MKLHASLQSRGLVFQVTDPDLDARLAAIARCTGQPPAAYVGFDPTSDSLHVGNFVAILALMHAQRAGLQPIAVVGGATGLIGDPSGKSAERQLQSREQVAVNVAGIRRVLERFLDFAHPATPAKIVNNYDWFGSMSAIDYLRDVGKHFRLGAMLAKESVRNRMADSADGDGMSYTEFSYQVLQAYDFHRLYREHRCVLQMGGSDQWGNITAGIDLIRKLQGESGQAFGLTLPLITTAAGAKFGKSEGNAVWLTADKTSVYDFHQFWLRVEDQDVARYLRYFTFLPLEEIDAIVRQSQARPEQRQAQRRLAEEVTRLVHGEAAMRQAEAAGRIMFGGRIDQSVDPATLELVFSQVPSIDLAMARLEQGWPGPDALVESQLSKSKSEARKLIAAGGFYVNNEPWTDAARSLSRDQLIGGKVIVLRSGKKNYRLVRVR
jgi:tyrosyl-tRNA synthetase